MVVVKYGLGGRSIADSDANVIGFKEVGEACKIAGSIWLDSCSCKAMDEQAHVDELELEDYPFSPANLYKKANKGTLPVGLVFTGHNTRKAAAPNRPTMHGRAAMNRANEVANVFDNNEEDGIPE